MFEDIAHEIFKEADYPVEGNEWLFDQAVSILSSAMAHASRTWGLSKKRVAYFEKQRRTLVEDLKGFKAEGGA